MTKQKAAIKPEENGKVDEKKVINFPPPKTFFCVFVTDKDTAQPKRLRITVEILKFIETVASTELDDNLHKMFILNNLKFYVIEEEIAKEVEPKK